MDVRPSPHTPYELKLRLAEEQAFYDSYATGFGGGASGFGHLVRGLADGLDSLSHFLRHLAPVNDRGHAA